MADILAPPQAYILLAISATVGSIVAALVPSLFPRQEVNSSVVPEQSLAADNKVVGRRRAVVVGFVVLLIAAWSNVVAIMLGKVADWTPYAWSHFIGLLLLLVVFVGVILALSDRLSTASTSFLEAPPKSEDGNGPTAGQV